MARLSQYRQVMNTIRSKPFASFTQAELEAMYPRIMREVNRRLSKMRRADQYDAETKTYDSPAAREYMETNPHLKLSDLDGIKGNRLNRLRKEIYAAVNFLENKTSTVTETEKVIQQLNNRYELELTHEQIRHSWRLLDVVRKHLPEYLQGYNTELEQKIIPVARNEYMTYEQKKKEIYKIFGITDEEETNITYTTNLDHSNRSDFGTTSDTEENPFYENRAFR